MSVNHRKKKLDFFCHKFFERKHFSIKMVSIYNSKNFEKEKGKTGIIF
jgi:hypothetical protein